jgi:polysaccharide biosynthesis protein PslG
LVAVLVCGCSGSHRPAAVRSIASLRLGVHQDLLYDASLPQRERVIERTEALLHPEISRDSLLWERIEPVRGHLNWTASDEIVDDLVAAHIQPLLVLVGSPSWANRAGDKPDHEFYVPTGTAFGTWVQRYSAFAAAAARRYRGRVLWEIWNEPNESNFWKPAPDVEKFAALYKALRTAIHGVDPGADVASGGVNSLTRSDREGIAGTDFLVRLLKTGLRPDAVAVHPYPSDDLGPVDHVAGGNNFDDIAAVHDALVAHRATRTQLWVTELGWSSQKVGLERQAEYLRQSLGLLETRFGYVRVAIVFIDYDRATLKQGLLDDELRPKPAARAFADAARAAA